MKRSVRPLLRAAKAVALPPQLIRQVPLITLQANTVLTVENHGGIISFAKERIVIDTALDPLVISGSGLMISRMDKEVIEIAGRIDSASYREDT